MAFMVLMLTRATAIFKLNVLIFATDWTVISVVFKDQVRSVPDTLPNMPDAAPAGKLPADLGATQTDGHPESAEQNLWSGRRTRILTAKYKELNPLVGTKGGFRQFSFTLSVNF